MNEGIGGFIRRRRTELGLPQNQVAERSGLTKSHMSAIEAGKIALPNADIRRRIAEALGVSHLDLLVAAGEITESELIAAGKTGKVERPADPVAERLCELVQAINWSPLPGAAAGLEEMLGEFLAAQRGGRRSAGGQGR